MFLFVDNNKKKWHIINSLELESSATFQFCDLGEVNFFKVCVYQFLNQL